MTGIGCGNCGQPLDEDGGYTGDAAYHRDCALAVYGDDFHEEPAS